MKKHTYQATHQNYSPKSHIFLRQDLKPTFLAPKGEASIKKKETRIAEYVNSGIPRSRTRKFFFQHKIIIPSQVSFTEQKTEKGVKFIFNSTQGEIQLLIPSQFYCGIEGRTITLRATDF
jgi:hypothetical protein